MRVVNTHEAKTQLSKLLNEVGMGGDVVIAKAGKPVARLIAYKPETGPRRLGAWKGKIRIAADFDEFGPELEDMFYGANE